MGAAVKMRRPFISSNPAIESIQKHHSKASALAHRWSVLRNIASTSLNTSRHVFVSAKPQRYEAFGCADVDGVSQSLLPPLFLTLLYSHLLIALFQAHKPFNFPRWCRDEWCPLSTLNLSVDGV